MQVPKRRGEAVRRMKQVVDDHITQKKYDAMKRQLSDLLTKQRPPAIKELQRLAEMGDFSENAGYQAAKWHLRRLNNKITSIEEALKTAIIIEQGPDSDGRIQIGSTVDLQVNDKRVTYEIVGGQETRPDKGRISHSSPLGKALLGHKVGELVDFEIGDTITTYEIHEVR